MTLNWRLSEWLVETVSSSPTICRWAFCAVVSAPMRKRAQRHVTLGSHPCEGSTHHLRRPSTAVQLSMPWLGQLLSYPQKNWPILTFFFFFTKIWPILTFFLPKIDQFWPFFLPKLGQFWLLNTKMFTWKPKIDFKIRCFEKLLPFNPQIWSILTLKTKLFLKKSTFFCNQVECGCPNDIPMPSSGFQWVLMGSSGFQWFPVGSNGF